MFIIKKKEKVNYILGNTVHTGISTLVVCVPQCSAHCPCDVIFIIRRVCERLHTLSACSQILNRVNVETESTTWQCTVVMYYAVVEEEHKAIQK